MDTLTRLDRAAQLRAAVCNPVALVAAAQKVVAATSRACDALVAFSPEGHAIGAVASALAHGEGRFLPLHRASHLTPLAEAPGDPFRQWMNVEEALGLGRVRPWVVTWPRERGAAAP